MVNTAKKGPHRGLLPLIDSVKQPSTDPQEVPVHGLRFFSSPTGPVTV